MKLLSICQQRLRHVALVAALAVAGTVMLANGAASSASANTSFNCESRSESKESTCLLISGPNEEMDEGEGDDYTHPEFFLKFWQFNGGSSYSEIWYKPISGYTAYHCYSSKFDGHIQVYTDLSKDNLAGTQRAGCVS